MTRDRPGPERSALEAHALAEAVDTELDAERRGEIPVSDDVFLVCRDQGSTRVLSLSPGQTVVVGRAAECTLVTPGARASRRHASLTLADGALSITDHASRNGTQVNGKLLQGATRPLEGGDVIAIGSAQIVVARADRALSRTPPAPAREPGSRALDAGDAAAERPWSEGLVLADSAMVKLFAVARRVASAQSTVLLMGETGTGKEVIAERIHQQSPRAAGPFVRLNCATLPEALIESELFGHEKGAFTGAERRKTGFFEAAHGGTLLLDEIGEMPLSVQARLLRVLERHAIMRVGGTEEVLVDVRILCATNRDLRREVGAGRFRQDLFYRISTFTLEIPPLRERPTEIVLLAELFAAQFARELGLPRPVLGADVLDVLSAHVWPGNVRELRNTLEHAIVMANGAPVQREHLPGFLRAVVPPEAQGFRGRVEDLERAALVAALEAEGGNRTHAAKRLGMSRRALLYKLDKYGLREGPSPPTRRPRGRGA